MNQEMKMFGCTEQMLDTQFKRQYNINMYIAGVIPSLDHYYNCKISKDDVKSYYFLNVNLAQQINFIILNSNQTSTSQIIQTSLNQTNKPNQTELKQTTIDLETTPEERHLNEAEIRALLKSEGP